MGPTMSYRIEILRSEKREIDEIDSKPFTMYLLKVTKQTKKDVDGGDAAPAPAAEGPPGDPVTVTLERKEGSFGFAFDSYSTGTYLLRAVEDGVAAVAGLVPSMKLVTINGEPVDGLSKYDVSVMLEPLTAAEMVWQLDAAGHAQGRAVREAAMREWTIYRRYSQFDELKNCMAKSFPEATKAFKFPPKVLLGNMKQSVIDDRTNGLGTWLNSMLSSKDKEVRKSSDLLAFLEASAATVKEGAATPKVKLTDIHGRTVDTETMGSEIVVFSAASRYNFQKLLEFVKPAQAQIVKEYPGLRAKFISVADVRIVPDNMKSMVEPVLRKTEYKERATMIDDYHTNTETGYMGIDSYFVPDYSGDVLNAIQCADANWTFRVFICMNGHVQKSFQSSMTSLSQKYADGFKHLITKYPTTVEPFGESTKIKSAQLRISARSSHTDEIELDAAACVAWSFTLKGGAGFSVTSADGELVSPSVSHKDTSIRQRTWLAAGKYTFTWKASGTLSGTDLSYEILKAN